MPETLARALSWLLIALSLLGLMVLWRPERLSLW